MPSLYDFKQCWNKRKKLQGIGRTQSMNASSRTSSYFLSGSGNSITFQNGPWTWTFGQNNKFMFKFMLSPINQQKSYHFHKKIGIWRGHFTRCCITPVNKTAYAAKCGQYARNILADIKLGNFNFNFKTDSRSSPLLPDQGERLRVLRVEQSQPDGRSWMSYFNQMSSNTSEKSTPSKTKRLKHSKLS